MTVSFEIGTINKKVALRLVEKSLDVQVGCSKSNCLRLVSFAKVKRP